MLRYAAVILLLTLAVAASALVTETASLQRFIYGDEPACQYDNWISHLAERIVSPGYNVYSPWDRQTEGFGGFHVPTVADLGQWGTIIDEFLLANWGNVDDLLVLSGFPYQLVQFNDTDTGRQYYLLRELPNEMVDDNGTQDDYDDEHGAFDWGWGLYIYNPEGDGRTIITAPHPCDDFFTPALSCIAFQSWNAQFLMIGGAGREVAWTNVQPYSNSKSLSDPTRVTNHPWYPAYTKFCAKIRSDSGRREFSAQIHSYDSSLHQNFSSVQISAGYNRMCPNLPVRDLSRFKLDLINRGSHLMIPQNTVGIHNDVHINDYYTVQYDTHAFTFADADTAYAVNNSLDLPAYSQNVQMNHTLSGWTDYDVFEPFFHAEMDELPNCYEQTDNTYLWFYNWNPLTQRWDMEHLMDRAIQYYSYWIEDMANVMDDALSMNDNLPPQPPANLTVHNQSQNFVTLRWQRGDDFDFDSYEIQFSTLPIGATGYSTYSRSNNTYLASPHCEEINVTNLSSGVRYYFKIRARDKNGNFSELSNEVNAYTSPVTIANYRAIGLDGSVSVKWGVVSQQNNVGFKVYRSQDNMGFELADTYLDNPGLAGGGSFHVWVDPDVTNGSVYIYRISSTNTSDQEFFHAVTAAAHPRDYFTLYLNAQNDSLADSLSFSANPNCSAGNDSEYDFGKAAAPSANYVYAAFWEQYWGSSGTYLQQEVMADFDPEQTYRSWSIRVKSDQLNVPLTFRVDDTFARWSEKLYLRDNGNGAMTDLEAGDYTFTVQNSNYRSFTLYWGNLQPSISISYQPSRVFQGNTSQYFYWSANHPFLVDHYDLSIQTGTDSLLIAPNLPNSVTNYNLIFPPDLTLHNARFYVDGWATDGQRIRQVSAFQFGLVPATTYFDPEPGLSMQANVWPNSALSVTDVFGAEADGWTMDTYSNWWQINPFNFGLGYWVRKINPFAYSSPAFVQRDSLSFQLRNGWNIIPNPHLCPYGVEDLRFRMNGITFSFAEFMAQKLVSAGIYVYRNGQYELTNQIRPQESFLLRFYGTPSSVAYITFIPYVSGPDVTPASPDWALRLTAGQTAADTDELLIGCLSSCSDEYDFTHDLPEPPAKPLPGLARLYLYKSHADTTFIDQLLNSEVRAPLGDLGHEEKTWDFRLEIGSTDPVNFTVDASLFPAGYGAAIRIGEWQYDIQHGNSFTYLPAQSGTLAGQIVVHNYFTGAGDQVAPDLLTRLKAYPNPFAQCANLCFSLGKSEPVEVDIYNVRGQRVKTLQRGKLAKGAHTLAWEGKDDNGRPVGSGVYLAMVRAGHKTRTVKLVLMK